MSRIVIHIEGGMVQTVYSDDEKVQVAVVDSDLLETGYDDLNEGDRPFHEFGLDGIAFEHSPEVNDCLVGAVFFRLGLEADK